MGRQKKDPNAEASTVTLSLLDVRVNAENIHRDIDGNIISWEGSATYFDPFTLTEMKLPKGTRGIITKIVTGEGNERKVVKINFVEHLEHLTKRALSAKKVVAKK